MKTKIITLESHDDLISIRDRLSWAKTPRILLVIPKFEKVALREVDFKILQRHAATLGAQLGLVTRTRRIRAEAEALGIPVFESTGQAQRDIWPKRRRRKLPHRIPDKNLRKEREQVQVREEAWRSLPAVRITALAIGVVSVLAVVSLFIPRAQIILQPVIKNQEVELAVNASTQVEEVVITGSMPAYEKRLVLDGVQTITVSGEGTVPQSKAKGEVEFQNITQQVVTIPEETVVTAGAVRFITTEEVTVPAGTGKKITAPVQAVAGGVGGNVDAETINAIEGRVGLSASVTNPEPITGGREMASVQASDGDRERLKKLLLIKLQDSALEEFLQELNSGDLLFEKTIIMTQILSEKYDPPPGAVGSRLTLSMQVEFIGQYASASDITSLGVLAMNASIPIGFQALSDAVIVTPLSEPFLDSDGVLRWNMRAEREISEVFDKAQVIRLVQGMGVNQAQVNLTDNLPEESEPKLRLTPSFWKWVPLLPFRIDVMTQ